MATTFQTVYKRFNGSDWDVVKFNAYDSDKLGGHLPSYFATADHEHDASVIVSGTLHVDRIPTLASLGAAAVGQTFFLGTTSIAINRASGAIVLTGITSIDGKAATTTKLATERTINIGTGVSATATSFDGTANITIPINSISEAYLAWGGKNLSGSYAPIDAAMVGELGANRLAFMPAASTTIEYSTDGGSTWLDYEASDSQKINFLNGIGSSIAIGKNFTAGIDYTNYQVRVIIHTAGGVGNLYTQLNKFVILVSTSGSSGSWCTIDARTQQNYLNSINTWTTFANQISISGWSGYNVINTSSITTYGNTPASQYGQVRFTFGCTGYSPTYSGLQIIKLMGFGGVGWTTPSNLAKYGNMYTYDYLQNTLFPAAVQGTQLKSTIATGTSPLTVVSTTVVTNLNADYLDGHHSSYFATADHNHSGVYQPVGSYLTSESDPIFTAWNKSTGISITKSQVSDFPTSMTPTAHAVNAATYGYGDATNAGHLRVGTGLSVATGTVSVSYGTAAGTACQGNDSRLSDSRTPVAHSLISTTGHTVSGLTTGHFLKALSATTYGFAAHGLTASDVGAIATSGGTITGSLQIGNAGLASIVMDYSSTPSGDPAISSNPITFKYWIFSAGGQKDLRVNGYGNLIFDGVEVSLSDHTHAYAPTSHASSATTHGLGTTANYGHVKTINALTQSSHSDGTALSAYQGYVLNAAIAGKAPTSHASSATTYGVGSTTDYGHVKIGEGISVSSGLISSSFLGAPVAISSGTSPINLYPVETYANKTVVISHTSNITIQIPPNSSYAYPVGTQIDFILTSNVTVTFAITTDSLLSEGSKRKINAQYQVVTLKKITTTSWVLFGALKA